MVESYSAFFDSRGQSDTGLRESLHAANVTDCFIAGLAYDVCVGAEKSPLLKQLKTISTKKYFSRETMQKLVRNIFNFACFVAACVLSK